MRTKLWEQLSSAVQARLNCIKTGNSEWEQRHGANIESLVRNCLPSGSGFDMGTQIDLNKSTRSLLVFHTAFHHMNEAGYYAGWTYHVVRVRPAFDGVDVTVTGPNQNGILEYIVDQFHGLQTVDEWTADRAAWLARKVEQAAQAAQLS